MFVIIFFKTMYNKTIIIRFGFCDILNNQGLGKCDSTIVTKLISPENPKIAVVLHL